MSSILKLGSKGEAVRSLQRNLNAAGADPQLGIDGGFGDKTDKAVRALQTKLGLVVDGKVGEQTMTALERFLEKPRDGAPEPDKSAMQQHLDEPGEEIPSVTPRAKNAATLQIVDTARKINEVIVHCTATPEGKNYTIADIRSWHKQRGFSDIGYHYVIARDGTVMVGRPVGQVGAHVEGHNTGTIGVSYIGGVTADGKKPKDTRTQEQVAALLWLVKELIKKFPIKKVTGHNQYANKACPSFEVRNDQLGKLV